MPSAAVRWDVWSAAPIKLNDIQFIPHIQLIAMGFKTKAAACKFAEDEQVKMPVLGVRLAW